MRTAPVWRLVNELIHDPADVRERYAQIQATSRARGLSDRRLQRARRAILTVGAEPSEKAVRDAWVAIAAARRTIAWARRLPGAVSAEREPSTGDLERLFARIRRAAGTRP